MRRYLLPILTITVAVLTSACATDPNHSSTDGHEAARTTHLMLARDFEEAGNEPMARYHREKAAAAQEAIETQDCGMICTFIDVLLESGSDNSGGHDVLTPTCRDPVTTPPSGPPRC